MCVCTVHDRTSGSCLDVPLVQYNLLFSFAFVDNTDSKEESNRSSLCDLFGVNALGMESGVIPDFAISSSSSYNEQSTGSKLARYASNHQNETSD
jgi:hypothetical protein